CSSARGCSPRAARCRGRCSPCRRSTWPPAWRRSAWPAAVMRCRLSRWRCRSAPASCSPPPSFTGPWNAMTERKKPKPKTETGRYAYDGLDRVIHEKARLGILTSLLVHPNGLLFGDLKRLCALTDGNLSRHLQALQEAGFVEVWKGFKERRPQTLCRITDAGRARFREDLTV